jgi:KaiC/GvpD/RAD55 family RecA-like ATPase
MDERIKSGVTGLDDLLGGGFPNGGTYSVVGHAGTGKSIMCLQFLYHGALDYNEPGVYVILEEDKERVVANMLALGFDIRKLEDAGKMRIIPYTKSLIGDLETTFERGMLSGETERASRLRQYLTVDSLFREIDETVRSIGAKRVVIDSFTALTLLSDNQVMARMQLLWLIDKLRRLKVTTLMTVEENIGFWLDMLFICDGTVRMMLKEKEGVFERGVLVEKMRGTYHDTGVRPFRITTSGIKVYPQEIIVK